MKKILTYPKSILDKTRKVDFIALLLLRLYLVPIFWMAGTNKYMNFESTVAWFGNADWGLGLPFPEVMVTLAMSAEILGAIFLLLGFGVRWIAIPLMITMLVAIFSVHWDHGWLAIASNSTDMTIRLNEFLAWLKIEYPQHHTNITALGKPVMLQNGIEFATTYFVMLLTLFFFGAGKYLSFDYWIAKWLEK